MEGGICDTVLLNYIEFQIFPSQNRYESYVGLGNGTEMVKSATLEPLLSHLPAIRELHAKGSDAKYKLIAPPASDGVRWFTKSTLVSFLNVVGLPEVVKATDATKYEISQLEEARKFHTSLYSKGQNKSDSGKTAKSSDGDAPISKAEFSSTSPDDSKNELLRAIDLRLTALRGDLATAFAEAAWATFSNDKIDSLEKFSHHFGATELRDSLCKLVELNQGKSPADFDGPNLATSTRENKISRNLETNLISKPVQTGIQVKYNASPAKAAQLERDSSSDYGEPSSSSEEEQQSVDRSRALIRSASPRRSASPMRRVQIGRSGSRRSTALTIKSLNQIPRLSQRDAAGHSSDEESLEQPPKKSESNVMRMSVQDAISLFENKQKDQVGNSQKASGAAIGARKSVLRRWSTGVGERSFQDPQGIVGENSDSMASNNTESDLKNESSEAKPERDLLSEGDQVLPTEAKSRSDSPEQRSFDSYCVQENAAPSQSAETTEELVDSAEWSRQKEAELNQLLLKMMETKPAKCQNKAPDNKKRQSLPTEQKGGFYDHHKEKRNEKLRHESNGKLEEKKKQFRAMQQVLDQRKAEMSSANGSEARKRSVKAQKPQRTTLQPADQNKEISKPSVVKKASSKASSPLPATRKSWPSTPSPKPVGTSPAKTPSVVSSSGTAPVRKKPQPASAVTRSSPRVEKPQWKSTKSKDTKPNDTKKSVEELNEKKQPLSKKPTKAIKPKAQSANLDSTISTKPSFYGRVTRKSSVVPVEPKPFLRKGSGMGSGVSPTSRTKVSSQPEETSTPVGDLKHADMSEMVSGSSGHVIELEMNLEPLKDQVEIESSSQIANQQPNHVETSSEVSLRGDCSPSEHALSMKDDVEESMISPTAWVEIEEDEEQPAPCGDNVFQNGSPQNATAVGMPSPRVRHSLSQMLLEESCEPDVIEWGNAENPPALVYQKEEPKGFKRLLKFARKSKTDANSSGWSTPSVFSEGEDDSEESKVGSKRIPENLLKKATLHAQNSAHGLSEKLPERQTSASVNTKATRSFFSLSAFKGGKQNEGKFR